MSNIEQTLSIIKPDAVEKRNLIDEIKSIFTKNNLKIKEDKKFILPRRRQQNFIKFIKQSLSMMIFVLIYRLDQLW